LPVPVIEDPNFLGLAKSDTSAAIMAHVDEAIAEMQQDGTVARIMSEYGAQQ
jgi:hypothetical protein